MSGCGHPPKLVTVWHSGADGKSYEGVEHQACNCGAQPTPPQPAQSGGRQ